MLRYLTGRLALILPTLVFVMVLNFLLTHLVPGDIAYALAGENATPEYLALIRQRYGLDEPLWRQFLMYVQALVSGDLGYSLTYQKPVLTLIAETVPATLTLVLAGMVLAMVVGTWAGVYAARLHPSWKDNLLNTAALTFYSLPIFWVGLILILVFSIWTGGLLPSAGMYSLPRPKGAAMVGDVMLHMILPTVTLVIYEYPTYFRLTRRAVLDVLNEDFVLTARAVGLAEKAVFYRHCLRNALLPNITVAGLMFGSLFSGALLTEAVFAWPGMGNLMYGAVLQRDLPLVLGIFTISALCVIVTMLLTDLAYAIVDPRVRYA